MNDENVSILVEYDEPGWEQVGINDFGKDQVEQAKVAVDNALNVVRWMAEKAREMLDAAHDRPDTVELEFGIKVGSKAGILVAQADVEAHIKAKVVWNKPTPKQE
ncbi:MAG: hypothetical protein IPK17_18155 [Chloroflexi bacterium]|uniref:CU044_2847 family protein n=1 Tax=Candidatus Flexifilum breve TaxID=3140694 RepID=UPI00313737AE|nr:hypothetical protein [Chloroflexota bacterium]